MRTVDIPRETWTTTHGADVALQVESVDGAKAILRFRVVALPETVDGMVHR